MSAQLLKIPCLGRPIRLGTIYDCRSHKILPGKGLWDSKALQLVPKTKELAASSFEVFSEDTIQQKCLSLGVDDDLKLCLLGEMVELDGAAKFLNDKKSSELRARVTLKHSTTTHMEELATISMELGGPVEHPEEALMDDLATHVVTGVIYGSDAFFVFDCPVDKRDEVSDVEAKMAEQVKCVPTFGDGEDPSVGGKHFSKTETEKYHCKCYSDLILLSDPATFDEAVKAYSELQQSRTTDSSIPKFVYMYPLPELVGKTLPVLQSLPGMSPHPGFTGKPQQIIRSVSPGFISQVEELVECFNETEMRAAGLKAHDICSKFVDIDTQLSMFVSLCDCYKLDFVKKLSALLPNVRGALIDEMQLADLLSSVQKSPFNPKSLRTFLEIKSKEVKQLGQYMKTVSKESKILRGFQNSDCDLSDLTSNDDIEHVVSLEFNVTSATSPFLKSLEHYLSTGESDSTTDKGWFEQSDLQKSLRSKLASFTEFVKANTSSENVAFVVSDHNEDTDASGPAIYCYAHGIPTEFEPPGKPGTPKVIKVTADAADLTWSDPKRGAENVVSYNVLYKCDDDKLEAISSATGTSVQIKKLKPDREYRVRVQAVSEPGVSVVSESMTIQTKKAVRLADTLLKQSKLVKQGNPAVYQLNLRQVHANHTDGLYKCEVGTALSSTPSQYRPMRVLMVVGATGAGKSTLIDGMTNYILGVTWDDPFRFKVIFEESSASQADSQTKTITAYTISSSVLPYDLTIIDTPGFGDTGGIERDKIIGSQIKKFFSESDLGGIDQLHGIGFVAQAPLARLTPTQKYIFHAVLSIFGKDIIDNIFLMVTFADANDPPLLDAVKAADIPYKDSFKFNNSALFVSNVSSDAQFNSFYWTMGTTSFENFFTRFSGAKSRSLALTREVLNEREQLETLIPGLQEQVKFGLNQLSEIEQEERVIEQRETEIAENKDFTYTVEVPKFKKIPKPSAVTTTCLTCNFTCHPNCAYSNDSDKYHCSAMDDGVCRVCPNKCSWEVHCNLPYLFEQYTQSETRTYEDLKKRYESAKTGKEQVTAMKLKKEEALVQVQAHVYGLIERVRQSLKRLTEIALKPNPLTEIEYLDLLIQCEESEAKPGYQRRITQYQKIRKDAELLKKTSKLPERSNPQNKAWWRFWQH